MMPSVNNVMQCKIVQGLTVPCGFFLDLEEGRGVTQGGRFRLVAMLADAVEIYTQKLLSRANLVGLHGATGQFFYRF